MTLALVLLALVIGLALGWHYRKAKELAARPEHPVSTARLAVRDIAALRRRAERQVARLERWRQR